MIRGKGGADRFVFQAGDGADRIVDFSDTDLARDDQILLARAMYNRMQITHDAQAALLDFGTAGSILLV